MTDINVCPCCGNSAISEFEEKWCGLPIRYKIKCFVCKHTIEKPNKRAAYKAWEKECKQVYDR